MQINKIIIDHSKCYEESDVGAGVKEYNGWHIEKRHQEDGDL